MVLRAVTVAAMLAAWLVVGPFGWGAGGAVAQEDAQEGAGIVDDETYRSPTYGYEVTWRAPWAADPSQTRSGVGASASDLLTLGELGGDAALRVEGFLDDSGDGDPLTDRAYVDSLLALFVEAFEVTCDQAACEVTVFAIEAGASPPTIAYDLTFPAGEVRGITSLATEETERGWIVFAETVIAPPGDLEAALLDLRVSVTVAGRPALDGVEAAEAVVVGTPTASPTAGSRPPVPDGSAAARLRVVAAVTR